MKKMILFLIVLIFFLGIKTPIQSAAEEYSKYLYLNDVGDVESIFEGQNFKILKFSDKVEYSFEDKKITLNGELITCDIYLDTAFLLVDKVVYKLKNGQIETQLELNSEYQINKIYYNDKLYLVGFNQTEGIILEYTSSLKEVMRYTYGKECNLKILDIVKYKNNFYLTATKNAHVEGGNFLNVGNFGETKTVLIKLNNRMNIENVLYINNDIQKEIPIFLKIQNDKIYFVVNTLNVNYYYQASLDLRENKLVKQGKNSLEILLGVNNEYIEVECFDKLKLTSSIHQLNYDIGNVINYKIEDSVLKVYSKESNNIYLYEIEEYHIDYLKEFNIGFNYGNYDFDQDMNNSDVIKIDSYFSNIKVYNQTIFPKNIPGTYELSLLVERENLSSVKLSTKANVHEYVNITNGGVYKNGIILYFLGNALLNQESISSGHTITKPGEYSLSIKDNDNNEKVYQFSVVDGYYLDYQPTKEIDYYLTQDELIHFKLENNSLIQEVIVDDEVCDFIQEENLLKIKLKSSTSSKVTEHIINKIKINDLWYEVNKKIVVQTLKKVPSITIKELNNIDLSLDILVDDPDKALQKIVIKINDQVFDSNYFFDQIYSLDDFKNQKVSIKLEYYYDLLDGIIRSGEILILEGIIKNESELIKLNFEITDKIEKINLDVKTTNFKSLQKINVNENSLLNHYLNETNYLSIYISLILTFVLIIGIILVILRKKRRKKLNQ